MKKTLLYIPALALLAVACQKIENNPSKDGDEPASAEKMIVETVSGSRGMSTKATISDSDASFAWTAGDHIAVHVSNGESHKYVFTSDSGASGASTAEASASFTLVYPEGYSRDAFAVFPSTIVAADAANYGQDKLDVTLPGSYILSEVSGETSPCPMISANEPGGDLDFYQLCGLLRLTVNGIPSSAKRLEICFDGKQVWGSFSVSNPDPGTSFIETSADDAHDVITVTKDGTDAVLGAASLVLNVPLPAGEYTSYTVTAYDAVTGGNAVLAMTRPFAYTASNKSATKRTASFPSSKTAFRGYEVSTGILERNAASSTYSLTSGEMILTADPATGAEYYSLPTGCNPFEPAVYHGDNANLDKYFNKWITLQDELGADGNNINASSDKLPEDWRFPSANTIIGPSNTSDWGIILYGSPKTTITVNGAAVKDHAYAMVSVTLESGNSYSVPAKTYYGVFLLRDGTTIPSGYLNKVGYKTAYSDNTLNETQFNDLVRLGCLFISASGYYNCNSGGKWMYPEDGQYLSSSFSSNTEARVMYFYYTPATSPGCMTQNKSTREFVTKLVKPLTD